MPSWATQYARPRPAKTPVGSRKKITYRGVYLDDGTLELYEAGEEDIYAKIQSHAESVDVNLLVQRYCNGEQDVLRRVQGQYLDVTAMPKDMVSYLQMISDAQAVYNALPVADKSAAGNSFERWLVASAAARPDRADPAPEPTPAPDPAPAPIKEVLAPDA